MEKDIVYDYDIVAKSTSPGERVVFERVSFANPLHIGESVKVKLRKDIPPVDLGMILEINHEGSAVSEESRRSSVVTESNLYLQRLKGYLDIYNTSNKK